MYSIYYNCRPLLFCVSFWSTGICLQNFGKFPLALVGVALQCFQQNFVSYNLVRFLLELALYDILLHSCLADGSISTEASCLVVFFLPWKVKVREKITELHLPSLFDDGWFLHWLDSSITRVALHLQPKYLLQLMLVVSQEKGKQCDMMIIKLPHKKTDFGNWYSNLLIFVIGPIETIVKNAISPFAL